MLFIKIKIKNPKNLIAKKSKMFTCKYKKINNILINQYKRSKKGEN
jgi:hypothetical protein